MGITELKSSELIAKSSELLMKSSELLIKGSEPLKIPFSLSPILSEFLFLFLEEFLFSSVSPLPHFPCCFDYFPQNTLQFQIIVVSLHRVSQKTQDIFARLPLKSPLIEREQTTHGMSRSVLVQASRIMCGFVVNLKGVWR